MLEECLFSCQPWTTQPKVTILHLIARTSIQGLNVILIGNLLGGNDYTPVSNMELRFRVASATQPQCDDIQLVNDNIRENDETFFVMLSSSDSAVMINPSAAAVTINNDDGKLNIKFLSYIEASFFDDQQWWTLGSRALHTLCQRVILQ